MKQAPTRVLAIACALLFLAIGAYAFDATAILPLATDPTALVLIAAAPLAMEFKGEGGGGEDGGGDAGPGFTKLKEMIEKQAKAWSDFRNENDTRLKAIEAKGYAPSDTVEKVDKANTELNKLSAEIADIIKKMQRPAAGGGKGDGKQLTPEQLAYKQALSSYLREGKDTGLRELEAKAMNTGSDPDGGFFTGVDMDASIDRIARAEMAMRQLATVRTVGKASYKKMVKTRGLAGGWIGEQEDSAESTAPRYEEIEIPVARVYAEPWITNDMLEDSEYDLEADVTEEAGIGFAEAEGTAYISGDGIKKPRGFLSYTMVANASWAWGKVGFIGTGTSGAFPASNPGDKLIDLQHSLKQTYRPGATFLMADSTLAIVRQMKDGSSGFYLWQPDPLVGFGGRVLGSPVAIDDYMPAIAASSFSVAYGNFKRGYTIVDRRGIMVIRDNVTKKGTTKFHFSRRVGGGISHFEAIKLLKFV